MDEARLRQIVREEVRAIMAGDRPDVPLTAPQIRKLYAEIRKRGGSRDELRVIVWDVAGVEREEDASQRYMDALLDAVAAFESPEEVA